MVGRKAACLDDERAAHGAPVAVGRARRAHRAVAAGEQQDILPKRTRQPRGDKDGGGGSGRKFTA